MRFAINPSQTKDHYLKNFRYACDVAIRLVNHVAGPVCCVSCLDQLRNCIPKYRVKYFVFAFLHLAKVKSLAAVLPFIPTIYSFHSLWRNLGWLQTFAGGPEVAATALSVSASSSRTTCQPGWFVRCFMAWRSIAISKRWRRAALLFLPQIAVLAAEVSNLGREEAKLGVCYALFVAYVACVEATFKKCQGRNILFVAKTCCQCVTILLFSCQAQVPSIGVVMTKWLFLSMNKNIWIAQPCLMNKGILVNILLVSVTLYPRSTFIVYFVRYSYVLKFCQNVFAVWMKSIAWQFSLSRQRLFFKYSSVLDGLDPQVIIHKYSTRY